MKIANILSIILTLILGIISLQWIFSPEEAANSLSMIYMEGDARNTQVRDFTAFFLGTTMMSFLSYVTKQYQWILSAGIVYLIAAIFNVLTSINYETDIAFASLISEIIFTFMAFTAAYIYKKNNL